MTNTSPTPNSDKQLDANGRNKLLRANARLILVVPVVIGLLAGSLSLFLPQRYRAEAQIAPSTTANVHILQNVSQSDQVRLTVATVLDMTSHYGTSTKQEAITTLAKNIKSRGTKGDLLVIEATDRDPAFAARIADALAAETIRQAHLAKLSTSSMRDFELSSRLEQAKLELIQDEATLAKMGITNPANIQTDSYLTLLFSLAQLRAEITFREPKADHLQDILGNSAQLKILLNSEGGATGAGTSLAGTKKFNPSALVHIERYYFHRALIDRLKLALDLNRGTQSTELKIVAAAPIPIRPEGPGAILLGLTAFAMAFLACLAWVLRQKATRIA